MILVLLLKKIPPLSNALLGRLEVTLHLLAGHPGLRSNSRLNPQGAIFVPAIFHVRLRDFVRRIKKSALGGFGYNQLRPIDTTRKSKLS
jgi:hypothetical protein